MIPINEDWKIDTDTRNVILYHKREIKKEGVEESWAVIGYFQCYEHALNALMERRLMFPDNFEALVAEIGKLREEIRVALMAIENKQDRFRLTGAKKL